MNTHLHSRLTGSVHRIVVKVGSGVPTRKNSLDTDIIASLSSQICGLHNDAQLIRVVDHPGAWIENLAATIAGPLGTGGMKTKITAARKLTTAGLPKTEKLNSRKKWIGLTLQPSGRIAFLFETHRTPGRDFHDH